ncbi:MAG: site-2 protease family protein, partial [Methylobacterium sp.]
LTLDPRLYIDPLTSIVLPVLFTILGGIGFPGGAVFVNRDLLRSPIWQSAVSLAGPAMNLVFLSFLMLLYDLTSEDADAIRAVLAVSALYQATAIVLNLLPIPGLDGYGIIRPWMPDGAREAGDQIGRYSGLVITGLFLLSGAFTRAIFGAGLTITANFGFSPQDVVAGYRLMRLW